MNIYITLRKLIEKALLDNFSSLSSLQSCNFTIARNANYGHFSSNVCILLSKILQLPPIEIGQVLEAQIKHEYIEKITIINGFLNFNLSTKFFFDMLNTIYEQKEQYGFLNITNKSEKINLEFVSCNPTGPLHIGHMRGAIIGNSIANLLIKAGLDVTKEYFVNDYGAQVIILAKSILYNAVDVILETQNIKTHKPIDFYPGKYLLEISAIIANDFKEEISHFINQFINQNIKNEIDQSSKENMQQDLRNAFDSIKFCEYLDENCVNIACFEQIKKRGIAKMLEYIKKDLIQLNIVHDVFFSECQMNENGEVVKILSLLKEHKLIENIKLSKPLGIDSQEHIEEFNYVFRSDLYEDDQPRVVQKANGEITYFASDLAYIANKINRGFNKLIYIFGYDHIGYIKRMQAGVQAISKIIKQNDVVADFKVYQMVNYLENGKLLKMSKRSGKFETVGDVIELICNYNTPGPDIALDCTDLNYDACKVNDANSQNDAVYHENISIDEPNITDENLNAQHDSKLYTNIYAKNALKFIMLSVKDSTLLNFDIEKVKEFSNNNIFFYIQYAYARINSVYANIQQNHHDIYKLIEDQTFNWDQLNYDIEKNIIIFLSTWPYVIEQTIETLDLSKIVKFLEDLAKLIHNLWSFAVDDEPYRIISTNKAKTVCRIGMLLCAKNIFISATEILGIELSDRLFR